MDNQSFNQDADNIGVAEVTKENNTTQECKGLSQSTSDDVINNILSAREFRNIKSHAHFRGPQNLDLEMNIYQPGYQELASSGVWKVFQKLRRLTGSKDIILDDIFAPLDPRGTGKVSSNVFIAALMGNIGYHATLTRLDIEQIAHFYTDKATNTVDYRSFIDFVQQPEPKRYDFPNVEADTSLAPRRHSTTADVVELEALCSVMDYVASVMLYKRIHLDAFLRENESLMKSRHTTIPMLKKVFVNLGIFLDDDHFNMLCKWFGQNAFQINTSMLLAQLKDAINRVSISGKFDPFEMAKRVGKRFINTSFPKIDLPNVSACDVHTFFQHGNTTHGSQDRWYNMSEDIIDLVTRLQRAIHVNQVIARPRFQQFDYLNTGRITIPQFKRALDQCGINTGGKTRVFVTPREIEQLIELYSESYEPGYVMWRVFVNDIESGTCIRDLHRKPSANISDHEPYGPRKEVIDLPCKYARRKGMTLQEHRRTERILEYVKQQLHDNDLYQFFRAFDKDQRRHVTRNQFREIMRMSNVILREQDVYDLELYFIDYHGFCYMFFLQAFGSVIPPRGMIPTKYESNFPSERSSRTAGYAPYEAEGATAEDVLNKIKNTVFQRGLRLKYFFKSFDKFNSGVMDEDTFVRALTASHNWIFTFSEYKKLMDLFRRPLDQNIIEYRKFLDALDEMYTQPDLERSPLVCPVPYQGWKEQVQHFSSKDWTDIGKAVNKVIQQGVNLNHLSAFKDMDRYHLNTVSYDKYLRAMDTLGVLKYLSEREQKLIFKAFTRPVYHRNEFDYTRFLRACHHVTRPAFVDE